MQSALAMKVRSGVLTQASAELQRNRLLQDVADGALEVFKVTDRHFRVSGQLIARHSYSIRLRALDAIQVAVALDLADQRLSEYFVAADKVLAEVATLENLQVINPEV